MDVFTLAAKLVLETGEFSAELQEAETQAKGFGSKKVWQTIGKAAAGATVAAGAAVVKLVKDSVETGMQFDAMMSEVQAVAGSSVDELDRLRDKAQQIGASTKFTATEAAEALYYMGLAGWDTEEMLQGIDGVINLAAASGDDLGRVSDIVTDAITAFGLTAEDSAHFVDVLAAASTNSNTTVTQMGEAFKYLATTGGMMNYTIDDIAVALGLLANNGIKATQAGTSMRQIINSLIAPTDDAYMAMEALGITLFEEDGKIKPFIQVMQELREAMLNSGFDPAGNDVEEYMQKIAELQEQLDNGDLDELQYLSAFEKLSINSNNQAFLAGLKSIGGLRGISSLLAIMKSTDEDFAQLVGSVENSTGSAQTMAETMLDNLQGDITILNSAFDGLKILISDEFTGTFRNAVQTITQGISDITASIRENGLAKGIWAWLIGENELDLIDDRLENDMNAAEANAMQATALTDYLQSLVDKYGEAATKTAEWKTATEQLEAVIPGVSEQLTAQGATLQENLDKVIAMKDEMRAAAIQQAMNKALESQYTYLGEQVSTKATAEVQRDIAAASLEAQRSGLIDMIREYSQEYIRLGRESNPWFDEREINGLSEAAALTMESAQEMGLTTDQLIEMIKNAQFALETAYQGLDVSAEDYLWNQSAIDALLAPEQVEAVADQLDAYQKNLEAANASISAADQEIQRTEEQIRLTEAAIERASASMSGTSDGLDSAGAELVSAVRGAANRLNAAGGNVTFSPHAKGAYDVPYNEYPALLHRGEMVLTSSQARRYRDGGEGIDFTGFLSGLRAEIKAGLESASLHAYMDGRDVTDTVSRRQAADYTARRYAT